MEGITDFFEQFSALITLLIEFVQSILSFNTFRDFYGL